MGIQGRSQLVAAYLWGFDGGSLKESTLEH